MKKLLTATAAVALIATAAQAENSAITLGKSTYGAQCALCHGMDGKGDGEMAELFQVPPTDLTMLAKNADGRYPFAVVYNSLASGLGIRAHGNSEMPVWGDHFMADAMVDRGVNSSDALEIAAGRILSVVYYLESIQQ